MAQPTPQEIDALIDEREPSAVKMTAVFVLLFSLLCLAGYLIYILAQNASTNADFISLRMMLTVVIVGALKVALYLFSLIFERKRRWTDMMPRKSS